MKKNIYIRYSILIICAFIVTSICAQSHYRYIKRNNNDGLTLVKAYSDSLAIVKSKLDSLYKNSNDSTMQYKEKEEQYYRLFVPMTFYHSVAENAMSINEDDTTESEVNKDVDISLMNIYLNHPGLVLNTERELDKIGSVDVDVDKPIQRSVILSEHHVQRPVEPDEVPFQIMVKKPNFWTISGDYYLQLIQNYVSDNWYNGGESNYSMVGSVIMQANFNNKSRLKFDNKLELKLGFQSSRSDSLHKFKTSEDLIRYTGKLGLQATKKWYYTFQLLTYTQFYKGYKSNDNVVYSDFMAPYNLNLSLGMDYTIKTKNNSLSGNINIAPIAYNFRYVGRLDLATRYGLDEGHHVLNDFGSEFTLDVAWKFSDMINLKTRLYGYTTYKRAEIEWENTISFQFNKYIATNIFIYPRFDDGGEKDSNGYWQLKEYASIGFAYSF